MSNNVLPIEVSNRGDEGVPVFIQDQTTGVLDLPFLQTLNATALAADTAIGSNTVALAAGHGTTVGNTLEISDTTVGSYFLQATAIAVAGDVITLDSPVPRIFTVAGSEVAVSSSAMNVDGSVTPVAFTVSPTAVQSGDMVRMICTIIDNADMDFETFGGLPALTRGLALRVANGDGTYRHIFNFKSNGDIGLYSFDKNYFANNGGGTRGFQARMTWGGQSKHGVVVRLDGSLGEELQLVVQDDLTGLLGMRWLAQGSELQS